MEIVPKLLKYYPYIDWPYQLLGWIGWLIFLIVIVWGIRHTWEKGIAKKHKWFPALMLGGILATAIGSLFIGISLPSKFIIPAPGLPLETSPMIMIFAAIPWVLAAGILGPFPAFLLGGLSGLFLGLWQTHSLFTVLEVGGLALMYSSAIRQRYRTPYYRLLRSPLFSAVLLSIVFAPVYIYSAFFIVRGSFAVRLDYAITQTWMGMLTRGVELWIAGLVGELVARGTKIWGRKTPLEPSPVEKSLQTRFFRSTAPLVLVLFVTLMVTDWIVAGNAARQMIRNRLSSTAQVAAESLPYFLETGQNLILNLADKSLLSVPPQSLQSNLATRLRSVPYFRQLYLFNSQGKLITGYPDTDQTQMHLSSEESAGIKVAINGVLIQSYTLRPAQNGNTAQVSFLAAIRDDQDQAIGVLLGRTDLDSNPFTQPAIQALDSVKDISGEGLILDENHQILFDSLYNQVMEPYRIETSGTENFYTDTSSTGTRKLVYYRKVIGRPWAVVITIPAEQTQQIALDIAVPLLGVLTIISVLAYFALGVSLRVVSNSLQNLVSEATLIADGRLDHPLLGTGVDEVGRLATAFEQMRASLKARMDELKRLLAVSEGVAANLEAGDALKPILNAATVGQVSSTRVVLVNDVTLDPHDHTPVAYGYGLASERYAYLDTQILDLMRNQQDLQVIPNTARVRRLNFPPGCSIPGALVAWPLSHENAYYGTLWIAYDQMHVFNDEELRYLSTLAGQAALAASNARLYASAEIGRQRLEAVLASTPEPVLVVDGQMRLLLLNPAALQVPGLIVSSTPGWSIQDVIGQPSLLELILAPTEGGLSYREITLSNGRIYYASVSPVIAEGHPVGKIAMLRDISYYKQLDHLKSEFVSTVSHDLRSPLTLMRGYATMLQMVGDLNEQQKMYVSKITSGVENMARLVNNLLDLGRIDAGIGLKFEKVLAHQVIDRVVNLLAPQANQKNIQLAQVNKDTGKPDGTPEDVLIEADPALLEQALYNLVENAIKYTPVGGQVSINYAPHPEGVLFEVRDTGIGIAPLDLPHIFEKFYRSGRREAYQQRGTGLGLAIVKSIAEKHHGRVWVDSYLGKGSSFYLLIPLKQD